MPRSPRIVVCSCEDITLADVEHCLERGYRDIESVKRYTGFGTGICQGRNCLHHVARIMVSRGESPEELAPFTSRPPLHPVALGMYRGLKDTSDSVPQGGEDDAIAGAAKKGTEP